MGDQILAEIYLDKGVLNTKVGDYSGAIQNYFKVIELYPLYKSIVFEKIDDLLKSFIKDAYSAVKDGDLYLAITSLKSIIKLNPELAYEWDSYILKLEEQIIKGDNNYVKDYINKRKKETIEDFSQVVQLGMTSSEVENILSIPKFIDEIYESNRHFEMWTYVTDSIFSRLYFENDILVRID